MIGPGFCASDILFIRDLAYISGLRGTDGTGVLQGRSYKRFNEYRVVKSQQEVSYYLWYHATQKEGDNNILDNMADNFMLGHVRAATKGRLSDDNAHPFDVGPIIGMHNGTLKDDKYNPKDSKQTDSELLFKDIAHQGLFPVLRNLDSKSAYALVVYNKDNGEITFIKNKERSLYYAFNQKRRVFYYASEASMLRLAADRRGIDLSTVYRFTDEIAYTLTPLDINAGKYPDWKTRPLHKLPIVAVDGDKTLALPPPSNQNKSKGVITLHKKTFDSKKAHSLATSCIYCSSEMTLYDQYKGTEIDIGIYSCESCDEIAAANMAEAMKLTTTERNK